MSSVLTLLLVCVGGALGAALRFVIDGHIRSRVELRFPLATTVINVTGSLLLGLLTGLSLGHGVPQMWHAAVGTGVLGGYTTFSTAGFETVRLIEDHRYRAAFLNGAGMLILAVGAAAVGVAVGLRI
ncbi:MAG: fluoride efflux transporter FluC [Propionibacteriaceae bacterium]